MPEPKKCENPDCEVITTNPKYCSKSCAAIVNNVKYPKRATTQVSCRNCGLEVKRKPNVYCSNKCQNDYHYEKYIERWLNGEETGNTGTLIKFVSNHVRRWLFEKYESSCQKCGWSEINPTTGKVPLEVNHVDGDSVRTTPDNIELLCPNCHSLTPTHKGLNRGNGRESRREYRKLLKERYAMQ